MTPHHRRTPRLLCAAVAAALACGSAQADEKQELEQLRATTLGLIEALVGQGLLSRERADALLRQAQTPAAAQWGAPVAAGAAAAPRNTIRVPYLSDTARTQIRDEIKLDVLAQARSEGWADSRQIPGWVKGLNVEGDVRVRWQAERFAGARLASVNGVVQPCDLISGNLPAECYRAQNFGNLPALAWAPDISNTTHDRERLTLRARFGVNAKLSDDTTAAVRVATGSTSNGATSTSQTLGSHFNKYNILLDRAWLRWEPVQDLRFTAGRMPNPFYSSDLLWPEDLNFDGVAMQAERVFASGVYGFFSAGAFPLQEFETDANDKWLYGLQLGADAVLGQHLQWRIGVAMYDFQNVEGVRETGLPPSGQLAGTTPYLSSQYPVGVRQKGNTLINLCPADSTNTTASPCTNGGPVWGLASKFRPINLTTGLTFKQFDPVQLGLTFDWVKNSAFDLDDIRRRAGLPVELGEKTTGMQLRGTVGMPRIAQRGDWMAYAAMRKFERDAWVDAFTDTTWHGGGTSYRGWSLGGNYGFDRNTSLGLRWTSTRNLDDGTTHLSSAPLRLDTLQLDLNARF